MLEAENVLGCHSFLIPSVIHSVLYLDPETQSSSTLQRHHRISSGWYIVLNELLATRSFLYTKEEIKEIRRKACTWLTAQE